LPDALPGLVLASASPRRRELLERLGLRFTVHAPEIDEAMVPGELPEVYVRRLALEKSAQVSKQFAGKIVLGADTAVVLGQEILGKPGDESDAVGILSRLAGQMHTVLTGIAVSGPLQNAAVVATKVEIRNLSSEEIEWYVRTREPLDKAGAYAIQGIGSFLVKRIEGSFSNVVGLPLVETLEMLRSTGMVFPWSSR
jgi:septum formation protein